MTGARCAVLASLLVAGCAPRFEDLNPLSSEITVEREIEIGAEIHEQLRESGALLTDPVLLDYVHDLGQQIVRVTEPQPFIYRFNLIESDELNAFAVPGGYIYLHSAVLAQVEDVSELAGVLAHEVAHVRRRHIAEAQKGQGLAQLATLAAVVLSGGHPAAVVLAQGINVSLQIQHTREAEADADHQGYDYLVRAGYDPRGMIRFFERILAEEGAIRAGVPPYLYTHPALKERIAAARIQLKRSPPPADLLTFDPRLRPMQTRLASVETRIVGGSGLHARAEFDRSRTDPLLEQASQAIQDERPEQAEALLLQAERLEPADPRVPLQLAELAERRGDLDAAAAYLKQALELDPKVALAHYKLGLIHKQLGDRTQAVFHLEQALYTAGPSSSLRRRAELEIRALSFPLLSAAGLGTGGRLHREQRVRFRVGETVTWWGSLSRQVMSQNPVLQVRWLDPAGRTAKEDTVRMDPFGFVSASLETDSVATGQWEVRVLAGDSGVDRRTFVVEPASAQEASPAGQAD